MKLTWSPLAIDRVLEIARYISSDNPDASQRWVTELFDRVDRLRRFPGSGFTLPDIPSGPYRQLLHGDYRVVYRVEETRILILTVRHGRRLLDPGELA